MPLLFTEEIDLDRVGVAAVRSVDGEHGGFGGDDEHTVIEADGRRPAGPGEVQKLAVGHRNFVVADVDHAEDAGADAVVGGVEVQADESAVFGGGRYVDRGRNDIDEGDDLGGAGLVERPTARQSHCSETVVFFYHFATRAEITFEIH